MKACAVICRNDHCYASRAQKPHFCVKTTKNLGKIAHSDTRMPILCSKGRKRGFQTPKAHKNADFVLGVAQISTERPSAAGKNLPKRDKTAWNEAQRPEAQRNATSSQRNRYGNAQEPLRQGTTKKETTFRVVSFKNWRLPTLPHGSAVPSAQVSLTSLFGMGRGGSSPLLPP